MKQPCTLCKITSFIWFFFKLKGILWLILFRNMLYQHTCRHTQTKRLHHTDTLLTNHKDIEEQWSNSFSDESPSCEDVVWRKFSVEESPHPPTRLSHWLRSMMSHAGPLYKKPLCHTDGRSAGSSFTGNTEDGSHTQSLWRNFGNYSAREKSLTMCRGLESLPITCLER